MQTADYPEVIDPRAGPCAVSTSVPEKTALRIHYLDNLRALAMMLGVFLHAGLAYANPAQSVWLATDPSSSVIVDGSIWFVHLFRLALFFLISGYFAKLVIDRKGVRQFLSNRAIRIVLPFIVFYPFLTVAMTICIVFGLAYVQQPTGLLGVIAEASQVSAAETAPPAKSQPLTTMHLWFLYYLIFFSLAAALLSRLRIPSPTWLLRRSWLIVFAPLILVPSAMAAGIPMNAPESFVPTWWPFGFYGLFFLAGWWAYGRETNLDKLQAYWIPMSVVAGLMFIAYYHLMPILDIRNYQPLEFWKLVVEALLGSYLSVLLVALSLLLGRRVLDYRNIGLRFIADSSYWVYLIHLPIVLLLQTLLIEFPLNVWLKISIAISGTLFISFLTYLILVRYTPIGWMLNGKRSFP
jgi:peptidoglycan/LPS O-acetylase OafA/YrhL